MFKAKKQPEKGSAKYFYDYLKNVKNFKNEHITHFKCVTYQVDDHIYILNKDDQVPEIVDKITIDNVHLFSKSLLLDNKDKYFNLYLGNTKELNFFNSNFYKHWIKNGDEYCKDFGIYKLFYTDKEICVIKNGIRLYTIKNDNIKVHDFLSHEYWISISIKPYSDHTKDNLNTVLLDVIDKIKSEFEETKRIDESINIEREELHVSILKELENA